MSAIISVAIHVKFALRNPTFLVDDYKHNWLTKKIITYYFHAANYSFKLAYRHYFQTSRKCYFLKLEIEQWLKVNKIKYYMHIKRKYISDEDDDIFLWFLDSKDFIKFKLTWA